MAAVEMSLDDIIALSKKNKKGAPNGRRFKNTGKPLLGKKSLPYRDLDDPEDNKKVQKFLTPRAGGNPNTIVRINLSNLAPTVTSTDLEELFDTFNVETATVHYNEHGESCGSGDVYLRKKDALNAMKAFQGVALDNEILHMILIDNSHKLDSRVSYPSPRRAGNGFIQKKGNRNDKPSFGSRLAGGPKSRRNGGKSKPKTVEELDQELDAYMKKRF